ncbi:MAG: (2Fe-2S)-binding protein [Fuerstiella sp.]
MPESVTDKTICRCLGIAESEVRAATDFAGCRTLCEIKQVTSAGKGCMSCHGRIKAILQEVAVREESRSTASSR